MVAEDQNTERYQQLAKRRLYGIRIPIQVGHLLGSFYKINLVIVRFVRELEMGAMKAKVKNCGEEPGKDIFMV